MPGWWTGYWRKIRLRARRQYFLGRAIRRRRALSPVANRTRAIGSGAILCFVTLRNEAVRLPYFLDYYRALGVDHFLVVDNDSDDGSRALADERREAGARVLTYGRSDDADVRIVSEHGAGFAWGARVALPGGREVDLALEVPGAHNVLNATGVFTALVEGLGIDAERAAHSLVNSPG